MYAIRSYYVAGFPEWQEQQAGLIGMNRGFADQLQPEGQPSAPCLLAQEVGGDNPADPVTQDKYLDIHNASREGIKAGGTLIPGGVSSRCRLVDYTSYNFV